MKLPTSCDPSSHLFQLLKKNKAGLMAVNHPARPQRQKFYAERYLSNGSKSPLETTHVSFSSNGTSYWHGEVQVAV